MEECNTRTASQKSDLRVLYICMTNKIISFIFIVAFIGICFLLFGKNTQLSTLKSPLSYTSFFVQPTPTPLPFQEMTVPYLRKKEYKSALTELNFEYERENYTVYTTSYTSDGLKINGLITKPMGEQPKEGWPAIVFVHGYIPPNQYETLGRQYTDYVDYLARNGFVIFKIDLRGHGSSQGEPGGGYYGSDYVIDALNAYAALESANFVKKDAIGMWGHSMAGNILSRSMAVKTTIPAAVIWGGAVFSYTDQQKYGIQDSSYQPQPNASQRQSKRRQLLEKVGSPSAQSAFWQQVAPIYYLNDLKGAIELHHAVDDDVVNVGYSRDLKAALDKTKVEHQLYEYETGGHNISGESFNIAMERTVEFFKKHLK